MTSSGVPRPERAALATCGLAVLGSYLLPAMHRLGGGYFSSSEFMTVVQSANKMPFMLGVPLGFAALAAAILPRTAAGAVALVAGSLGLVVHAPAFGDLANTGRHVAWPLVLAGVAGACLLAAAREAGRAWRLAAVGFAAGAVGFAAFVGRIDHAVPNELGAFARRSSLYDASLLQLIARAIDVGDVGWWIGPVHAAALAVALIGALVGLRSPRARAGLGALTLFAVLAAPLAWVASSLDPESRYSGDLMVRVRVALVWATSLTLLGVGASLIPSASAGHPRRHHRPPVRSSDDETEAALPMSPEP